MLFLNVLELKWSIPHTLTNFEHSKTLYVPEFSTFPINYNFEQIAWIVFSQADLDHILDQSPLSNAQLWFQQGKSTALAILAVPNGCIWLQHLEKVCNYNGAVYSIIKLKGSNASVPNMPQLWCLNQDIYMPTLFFWVEETVWCIVNEPSSDYLPVLSGVP